jgi:hypothetical protein
MEEYLSATGWDVTFTEPFPTFQNISQHGVVKDLCLVGWIITREKIAMPDD